MVLNKHKFIATLILFPTYLLPGTQQWVLWMSSAFSLPLSLYLWWLTTHNALRSQTILGRYIYRSARTRSRCWLYMRSTRPAGWGLLVQSSSSKKDGCMGAPVATPYRSGCPIVHPHGVDYGILYSQDQAKDGWAQSNKKNDPCAKRFMVLIYRDLLNYYCTC